MDDRIARLQQMSVFGGLRADILETVLRDWATVHVREGEDFFHEGDSAGSVFVLLTGRVVVMRCIREAEHRIRELGPGDCFGEMALLDLAPRSASVRATEDCTALEISPGNLLDLYDRDAEQFAIIEMNMGREISRRLRDVEASLRG